MRTRTAQTRRGATVDAVCEKMRAKFSLDEIDHFSRALGGTVHERRADGADEVAVWPAVELSPAEAGEWCASGADSAALETGAAYLWEIPA